MSFLVVLKQIKSLYYEVIIIDEIHFQQEIHDAYKKCSVPLDRINQNVNRVRTLAADEVGLNKLRLPKHLILLAALPHNSHRGG